MIPIKLRVKGLYSYQQEAEIDFERLVEGGLFGIFGAVGSGKSTLLEAITFALYGRSERLDSRGQNYNMMNLRSHELLIDFTFGLGEETYRFEVVGRRNSKKFEDVRSFKRTGYIWERGDWVPLPSNDGGKLLGLNYENFTKTIIIPQGKFKDFLHLTPAARTQMLKELFDLERFDLLRPTSELLTKNTEELNKVKGQLIELPEQDPIDFRVQEKALKDKEDARIKLANELKTLRQTDREMNEVKDLLGSIGEVQETLSILEESEAEYKERAAFLDRYELADRHFRETLVKVEELSKTKEKAAADVLTLGETAKALEVEIATAEQKFRETKAAYEKREEWKRKAEEMNRMQQMQELDAEINILQGRIDKGTGIVKEKEELSKEKRAAEKQLEEEIAALRKQTSGLLVLMEVQAWMQEKAGLEKVVETAAAAKGKAEEECQNQEKEVAALRAHPGGEDVAEAITQAETALAQTQAVLDNLRLQSQLADFAEALAAGAPCPLCGATDHPAPYDAGHADAHLVEAQAKKNAQETDLQRLRRLALDQEQARKVVLRAQVQVEQRSAELAEAEATRDTQAKTFRWPEFAGIDAATLTAELAQRRTAEAEIRSREAALAQARAAFQEAESNARRYAEKISELRQEQASMVGRHAGIREQLEIFEYKNHKEKKPIELRAKEDFFTEQYETVTANYQREDQLLHQRKDAFQKVKTDMQLAQQDVIRCEEELLAARALLLERLEMYAFPDLQAVQELLAEEINLVVHRREIENFQSRLQALRTELATFQKRLAGRSYDAEAHLALQERLKEKEIAVSELIEAIGQLKNQLQQLGENMKKRLALEKHKDALQDRGENLSTLRNLFIGSGFVNFVSTMYLHELCQRANARFQKLTRNQLSLIVRDDNTFQVRDMINDGQVRSVKTLSGGQTFQAALSLALALADNIQHRSDSHHNFFFLDEGFGTLDGESLQIVFDTLKQLRHEKRIVGVISHVEKMQEEIDQCLKVWQDEEKGSFVKGSWE